MKWVVSLHKIYDHFHIIESVFKLTYSPMYGCCLTCNIRVSVSASFTDTMTSMIHMMNSIKMIIKRYFSNLLRRSHSDGNIFWKIENLIYPPEQLRMHKIWFTRFAKRMCMLGLALTSFKWIDPMLLVSSSAKSVCL